MVAKRAKGCEGREHERLKDELIGTYNDLCFP